MAGGYSPERREGRSGTPSPEPRGAFTLRATAALTQRRPHPSAGRGHPVPSPAVPSQRMLLRPSHFAFLPSGQLSLAPAMRHSLPIHLSSLGTRSVAKPPFSGLATGPPRRSVHNDGHSKRRGGGTRCRGRLKRHNPCCAAPPTPPSCRPAPSSTCLVPLPPHPLVQTGDPVCCRAPRDRGEGLAPPRRASQYTMTTTASPGTRSVAEPP